MIKKTKFKDLYIFENKSFRDNRGYFKELLKENKIKKKFLFSVMSYSKKNVIRGLHLQKKKSQGKFVTVIKGKVYDVALDLRKKSKTYGKKYTIILSDKNSTSLFIPAGFAHGFCTLEKENLVFYGCTNYRSKKDEIGIIWNDNKLKIKWPIKKPLVSKKDKKLKSFLDFKKTYR